MKRLLLVVAVVLAPTAVFAAYSEVKPGALLAGNALSTNWLTDIHTAIPGATVSPETKFEELTNLLCLAAQKGNVAAQGLWGMAVLMQSHSPEETKTGLTLIQNSASNGYVPAMLNLGLLLEGGVYLPRDHSEAFHWFSQAAMRTNAEGILQLGGCYYYGIGTSRDAAKAAECYRRAAELTNYIAMKSLGFLLANGIGVKQDQQEAKHWFSRAAIEGKNRRAMYDLGTLCMTNFSDKRILNEGFQWFRQSAELGDPLACMEVANFYYQGRGIVETNIDEYRFWRSRAAVMGATHAQYLMGDAYRTGDGVPKDENTSMLWYRKAAEKHHPAACFALAARLLQDKTNRLSRMRAETYMLDAAQGGHREAQLQCALSSFRGDMGQSDCEAGKRWLAISASNGWSHAEFWLFYYSYSGTAPGSGCSAYPKDTNAAIGWLRRASEHEDLQAQERLAVFILQGKNVRPNPPEAERLLRNAAEHGNARAQNDLGFAISTGALGKHDLVEAAVWCELAQMHMDDTNAVRLAGANLQNILPLLDTTQRHEVNRRVQEFRVTPFLEDDPLVKGWDSNPSYQAEDGQFGN